MAKPLDDRIAAAISADARATTVAELITEVGGHIAAAQTEHDQLDAASKSAASSEDAAEAAAEGAAKLGRRIVRLNAKRDQLSARLDELLGSERRVRVCAAHAEVQERRDALAAELRTRVPALFAELVCLLERIEASDADCDAANRTLGYGLKRLESAELIARDLPTFGVVPRLTKMKLPAFTNPHGSELLWPRTRSGLAALQDASR